MADAKVPLHAVPCPSCPGSMDWHAPGCPDTAVTGEPIRDDGERNEPVPAPPPEQEAETVPAPTCKYCGRQFAYIAGELMPFGHNIHLEDDTIECQNYEYRRIMALERIAFSIDELWRAIKERG